MSGKGKAFIRNLCVCAMMVAAAVVLNLFRFDFFVGGSSAKHISLSGAFLAFAALTGGPVYGAAAFAISDILSVIIKPQGAYIPLLTIVAALKGAAIGGMWALVRSAAFKRVGLAFTVIFSAVTAFGIFNQLAMTYLRHMPYTKLLIGLGKDADLLSIGLMIGGVIGLVNCAALYLAHGLLVGAAQRYMRCMFALLGPALVATAINTPILKLFVPVFSNSALAALLVPRLAFELVLVAADSYLLVILMAAQDKVFRRDKANTL